MTAVLQPLWSLHFLFSPLDYSPVVLLRALVVVGALVVAWWSVVVALTSFSYGLTPIMDRLSKKLWDELKPGALIVSNVFSLPTQYGWVQVDSDDGVYVYTKPLSAAEEEEQESAAPAPVAAAGSEELLRTTRPQDSRTGPAERKPLFGGRRSANSAGAASTAATPSSIPATTTTTTTTTEGIVDGGGDALDRVQAERRRLRGLLDNGGFWFSVTKGAEVQHELEQLERKAQFLVVQRRAHMSRPLSPMPPAHGGGSGQTPPRQPAAPAALTDEQQALIDAITGGKKTTNSNNKTNPK
jgi:hypothetical protein